MNRQAIHSRARRAIYITQSLGTYGSEQSLKTLLNSLPDTEVTLVGPRYLGPWVKYDAGRAKALHGPCVKQVHFMYLPSYDVYDGAPTRLKWRLYSLAGNLFSFLASRRITALIKAIAPDYVHLNTTVLAPILRYAPAPCFLHVREIVQTEKKTVAFRLFSRASGLICIDHSAEAQFRGISTPPRRVITNPVDMTSLEALPGAGSIAAAYGIPGDRIIVSCIGRITPIKGVDTVISALRQSANPHLQLLIVGERDPASRYFRRCEELAGGDSRIRFLGEEKVIGKIYKLSDYVVRGDPDLRIGRTVIEGLYSGCVGICPGDDNEVTLFPELKPWQDRMRYYSPRNPSDLARLFDGLTTKVVKGQPSSNTEQFAREFTHFIEEVLAARRS